MSKTLQLPLQLDGPVVGAIKGERSIMAYPFFDLDKRALKARIEFEDPDVGVRIAVRAAEGAGVPTIYDKDLVLYVATVIAKRMDDGKLTGDERDRIVNFSVHDFFRVAGRSTDSRSYERFKAMLDRLTSATISTNIEVTVDDETIGADGWFEWFERTGTGIQYRKSADGKKRISHVRIVVGKWLFNAIVKDRRILTYAKRYFDLEPVPRRLYDLARVHVGHQERWQVRLPKLQARIGDHSRISHFLSALKKLEVEDPLPEYRFRIIEPVRPGRERRSAADFERTMVVFTARSDAERQPSTLELSAVDAEPAVVRHPQLVRHLTAIGFGGCLGKAKAVNRALRERGRSVHRDRDLACDPVLLANLLVELGLELPV
ncbi:MAG: replication initiator protein A [Bauldia litoralis]